MDATITALFVYPVKSCRGIALERGTVERRGLRWDRRWMIVDEEGVFVTQRTQPRLAQIDVAVTDHSLTLSAPDRRALVVPLPLSAPVARRRVRVWRDEVDAVDCGGEAADWLASWLDCLVSLVFMPDDVERAVSPDHAALGDVVGFADGFPLLLASTASLDDLNARLSEPLPMNRFRPNIVVSGCAAWAEDGWSRIRAGGLDLRLAKPCARCVITTTDQSTGKRSAEPLRTLATFRARDNEVLFAQNCIPDSPGTLLVGDPVTVLQSR